MTSLNTDVRATWRDTARKDPDEIEHDIDDTRADVQATLETLERKLSPEHLLDLTLGRVRAHGGEFAGNLGHAVKENPVPLLLTSIGIAWMMMSGRQNGNGNGGRLRDRMHEAGDRWTDAKEGASERLAGVKDTLHGAREGARERIQHSRDTLSHAAGSVRETTRRAADTTRAQLARARSGADYLLHEQPLVLGAIGIAAGALIGAALPATEEEDRMLGSSRDRALDKAKRAGAEGYRKVRDRAEDLAEQAKTKLHESTADGGDGSTDSLSERDRSASSAGATSATGSGAAVPSSAWVAGTDNTANQSSERDRDKAGDSSSTAIGENPSEPRRTKRRPSERGVGREHSSDSFSTPDQSPTSKTPPL